MKIKAHAEKCSGCHLCEMACSIHHLGVVNINRSAIRIRKDDLETGACEPAVCRHCENMPCMAKDHNDPAEYRVRFVWDEALSDACPFKALFQWGNEVYHCDLCEGEPQCVRVCSTGAIEIEND